MKYLVIGGAGFIGSHLAEYLVSRGNKVKILDNFSTGLRENIGTLPVEIIEGDIRDLQDLRKAVQGVQVVFHLAALSSASWSEEEMNSVNITGTMNVLEACVEAGVRRVVASSSSAVYRTTRNQSCHEFTETMPVSPYGVSKLLSEMYCQMYWNTFHLETVVLRYFTVFGPRQNACAEDSSMIPRLLEVLNGTPSRLPEDGMQRQDLTYIDNVVQANALAATGPKAAGKVFNIAEGKSRSLLEMAELLNDGGDCEIRLAQREKPADEEAKSPRACIERAREFLGFTPTACFEEGLMKTVEWYRQSRERPVSAMDVPAVDMAVDMPAVVEVCVKEFPRVREFQLPLKIQRWLQGFKEIIPKPTADDQEATEMSEPCGLPSQSRILGLGVKAISH